METIGKGIATAALVVGVVFVPNVVIQDIFIALISGLWVAAPLAKALGIKM